MQKYNYFVDYEGWRRYRFSFSGAGVHGRPAYSGRRVSLVARTNETGLQLLLLYGRHLDHLKSQSGSWESESSAALRLSIDDRKCSFHADLMEGRSTDFVFSVQALSSASMYVDLQDRSGILFSGKVFRSWVRPAFWLQGIKEFIK